MDKYGLFAQIYIYFTLLNIWGLRPGKKQFLAFCVN